MKHYYALSFLFVFSISYAQTGSGTITFTTTDGLKHPIYLNIYNIVNPNGYRYLSGNTNEPIPFSGWEVESTLGLNESNFDKNKVTIFGNPSNELYAKILTNDSDNISARILDINGKIISSPEITYDGNYAIIKDPLTHVAQGIYFVQIHGALNHSFKFIKNNTHFASSDWNVKGNKPMKFEGKNTKQTLDNENYKIFLSSNDVIDNSYKVQVLPGSDNNFVIPADLAYLYAESGDVAINPLLKGLPKDYNRIKLTNTIVPDSTYSINTEQTTGGIFWNIYVPDSHNPVQYKVEIEDDLPDGTYLPTTTYIDVYQDNEGEINGNKTINLNPIPNVQDITTFVRDYKTLNKKTGQTVHLKRLSDDVEVDAQVSDANGKVIFNDVPGNAEYYLVNEGANTYKKTNGKFVVPLVDLISEMTDTLNVTSVDKFNYEDGTAVTADTIQMYKPLAVNTELALGHWRVYFPPSPNRQQYIDHFNGVLDLLGMSGAMIPSDTPFAQPTQEMIDNYNPHPQNRQVYDGQIGTNITDYVGTQTINVEKILANGNKIAIYSSTFELGGLDWSAADHETGNTQVSPPLNGNTTTFKTSRDVNAAENYEIKDSKHDKAIMPLWLELGVLHYNSTDSEGRLMDYNMTTKFE